MKSDFLNYRSSAIHYSFNGKDGIPLICFHGYGEDSSVFSFLEQILPATYCLIAIDLPYHGKTEWKEERGFSPADLIEIITYILPDLPRKKTIPLPILMGFSLGGRIALSLYEQAPQLFQKIILLAPDGLKLNPWYWFATQTQAGNRFFKLTMQQPGWFLGLLKAAHKLGLVNASIFKFVNYYIADPEVRRLLYLRWTTLGPCRPQTDRISGMVRARKTPVRLVYGQHDRIIHPGPGERFRKNTGDLCSVRIIESGHQVLHPKHGAVILEEIMS